MPDDRETFGRVAHNVYRDWWTEQPPPKVPFRSWDAINPEWRELMMRIAAAVAVRAVADAGIEADRMRAQILAFAAERDRAVHELKRRAGRAVPGIVRDAWLDAADMVAGTQKRSDEKEAGHVRPDPA